jgi:uncharacterized membrane protein YhaH (DUF805 family)
MYEQVSRVPLEQESGYENPKPLSLTQRLNRMRYCCYSLTGGVIVTLVAVLLGIYSRATFMPRAGALALVALLFGGMLAAVVWFIGLLVRRLHDTDRSGWWILLAFVPLANFLLMLYLLLAPGTSGPNRFGPPNPPNGPLVLVFGGFWWGLQVLMMLANLALIGLAFLSPQDLPEWNRQFVEQWRQMFERIPGG